MTIREKQQQNERFHPHVDYLEFLNGFDFAKLFCFDVPLSSDYMRILAPYKFSVLLLRLLPERSAMVMYLDLFVCTRN